MHKADRHMIEGASMRLFIAVVLSLATLVTAGAGSASAVDWKKPVASRVEPLYPYKDLPGVKAKPDKTLEEQYACRTETIQIRRRYDRIFRSGGMPTLVYVCDRDGVISAGDKVPLRGHYQPVR
jgi:hypothetical protein